MFPQVTGSNLLRQQVDLPAGLAGELNLLLIAFQQWQQRSVDTWIPYARQAERAHPSMRYYELPVIQSMDWLRRTFINEGMRAGIPDGHTRERTITLYLDKAEFRRQLGLPDEQDIYVLLVNRQGFVLWQGRGPYTQEKANDLDAAIDAQFLGVIAAARCAR